MFGRDSANLMSNCESVLNLVQTGKVQADGWRFPADFHVTCCYLNRDEDKADESEIYQDFEENVAVDIQIDAFVIVPDKIITGICFPDQNIQQIENPCPHVTLALNEWEPQQSNVLLEKTCIKESQAFFQNYQALKRDQNVKEGKEILQISNLVYRKNSPAVAAYFVTLDEPIILEGTTAKKD